MKKLIFEKEVEKRPAYTLPKTAIDSYDTAPIEKYLRKSDVELPYLNEYDVASHYKDLLECKTEQIHNDNERNENFLYPVFDDMCRLDGFTGVHPYQLPDASQGAAELVFTLEHMVSDMFGMAAVTFQPRAITGGIFTALSIIKAYGKKYFPKKNSVLVSRDADEVTLSYIKSFGYDAKIIDFEESSVKKYTDDSVMGAIIKNPDGNGNFISDIAEINAFLHEKDCIVCCDANNFASLVGIARPGDMGFDIMYFDIDNMFDVSDIKGETDCATLGVTEKFLPYMPVPEIDIDEEEQYCLNCNKPDSIGKVNDYYGDFRALIKVLSYILSLGYDGLTEISHINALKKKYSSKV